MDPATIFQTVGAAVSMGDLVLKCFTKLSNLKAKYRNVSLHISTIIGQLYMIQAALNQLETWNKSGYSQDPRYQELASQINNSLDCFSTLMLRLEEQLSRFDTESPQNITAKSKVIFLWNEKETSEYSTLLDRQVNALHLLLQAIQCQTWQQQNEVVTTEESQQTLQLSKDCSSSLIGLDDSRSMVSGRSSGIRRKFDFDDILLCSNAYQRAGRSDLRQANRNTRSEIPYHTVVAPYIGSVQAPKISQTVIAKSPRRSRWLSEAPRISSYDGQDSIEYRTSKTLDQSTIKNTRSIPIIPQPISHLLTRRLQEGFRRHMPLHNRASTSLKGHLRPDIQKLYLLGSEDSEKTTLLKSFLALEESECPERDGRLNREDVWNSIIHATQEVIRYMKEQEIPLVNKAQQSELEIIQQYNPSLSQRSLDAIKLVWADADFKKALKLLIDKSDIWFTLESAVHYSVSFDRILSLEYVPTTEDILWCQKATGGPYAAEFTFQDMKYEIWDVGQQSAIRNYIYTLDNVSNILYTFDVTAYTKTLRDDSSANRMKEQLTFLKSLVDSRPFQDTTIIIVLTKLDILENYLHIYPIEEFLEGYKYDHCFENEVEHYLRYIEERLGHIIQSSYSRGRVHVMRAALVEHSLAVRILKMVNDYGTERIGIVS